MAYHYNTRARARSDVEPDDIGQGDLDVEMTAAIVSESATVGYQVESAERLESQSTEVAGSVTTHSQLLPEGGHSSVGGHGSLGSLSSSSMGVTLGYPSRHPDPHSSTIVSAVESQALPVQQLLVHQRLQQVVATHHQVLSRGSRPPTSRRLPLRILHIFETYIYYMKP